MRDIAEVRVVKRGEDAGVERADIIVTATNSDVPVLRDVPKGVHINAIGSYRPDMRELDEATMARAKVIVDSRESAKAEAGELQGDVTIHAELGEIILGLRPGRESAEEVTVFKSVGNAAQDAAIGRAILAAAEAKGIGQIFDFG